MINYQNHNRADDCDEQAVEIESGCSVSSDQTKEVTSDKRTYNSKDNIYDYTRSFSIYDFTGDEPSDKAKDYPADNVHVSRLPMQQDHGQLISALPALKLAKRLACIRDLPG